MGGSGAKVSPYAHLGIVDPSWTKFVKESPPGRVRQLVGSPQELRDINNELKMKAISMAPTITKGLTVKDASISVSDGASILVRVYTPTSRATTKTGPGMVYFHGGGWTLGDLDGEDVVCRAICVSCDLVVVSVDYRLAPEYPFPKGLDDAWDALLWTIDNAKPLGIDTKSILIAGFSAGGNLTAVLAYRARDRDIPLKGQILRIPATCHIDCYPPELQLYSMEELKDAPFLEKRSMELFWGYYNPPDPRHPDVSPLLNKNFKGLAPAYVQISGMDPLRDEGLAYADKLKQAGIPTKVDIYPGLPHAFGAFPEVPAGAKNMEDLLVAINELVKGKLQVGDNIQGTGISRL